jgi:hypothetical protein
MGAQDHKMTSPYIRPATPDAHYDPGAIVTATMGDMPKKSEQVWAEYEVPSERAEKNILEIRIASSEPRPLDIFLNGDRECHEVAGLSTGGTSQDSQRWVRACELKLKEGVNRVRISPSAGIYLPAISKLMFTPIVK